VKDEAALVPPELTAGAFYYYIFISSSVGDVFKINNPPDHLFDNKNLTLNCEKCLLYDGPRKSGWSCK